MLKVFHTADWHLGQSLFGFDRDEEHRKFLDWLLEQLSSHRPDALVIAGDIFDSVNPSSVAQKRYYQFLAESRAALPELQIIVTAGNHDAGSRLEAPSDLLESLKIHVVGTVQRDQAGEIRIDRFLIPVSPKEDRMEAIVMAVPFLRPSDVPVMSDAADPYLDGIRELYRRVTAAALEIRSARNPNAALIAMGHCHLHGGEESRQSERQIVIGGSESIGVDVFAPEIAYVALGHLHRAQQFDGGRVRYSGSPIPLSFAESGYRHAVRILEFDQGVLQRSEDLPIPRFVELIRLPETGSLPLTELLSLMEQLGVADNESNTSTHPFLELRVLEDQPDPTKRQKIEQALIGRAVRLAAIRVERSDRQGDIVFAGLPNDLADLKSISPEVVLKSVHREKYSTEPEDSVMKVFREILLNEAGTP